MSSMRSFISVAFSLSLLIGGASFARAQEIPLVIRSQAIEAYNTGDYARAEALWREVLSSLPGDARALSGLGISLLLQGHEADAQDTFQKVFPIDPVLGYLSLGTGLAEKERFVEAEEAFLNAISHDASDAVLHYNLGVVIGHQNRLPEAEAAYTEAIRLDPNYVDAHYNLGNVLKQQERYEAADAAYRRALELEPSDTIYGNLGISLNLQERYAEAETAYGEAIRLGAFSTHLVDYHQGLGYSLLHQEKYVEAEAAYRAAIAIQDTDISYRAQWDALSTDPQLGSANISPYREEYATPEAAERAASERTVGYADAHYGLGVALFAQGREREANQSFREAIRLNPDFAEVFE